MAQTIRITEKKIVDKVGKGDRPYQIIKVRDETGTLYSGLSFLPYGDALTQAREGDTATLEFESKQGEFGQLHNITNFELLDQPEGTGSPVDKGPSGTEKGPSLGDGSYIKGADHPQKIRSISAQVALKAAIDAFAHTISRETTPKQVSEKVRPLAADFYLWLVARAGIVVDDDVPF